MSKVIPNEFDWDEAFDSTCGPLVEGLQQEKFSTARAKISDRTQSHYHQESNELYIVLKGKGKLRSKDLDHDASRVEEEELYPGKELLIKPNTVHQTEPVSDVLVVETVNFPPWTAEDEYIVEDSLF